MEFLTSLNLKTVAITLMGQFVAHRIKKQHKLFRRLLHDCQIVQGSQSAISSSRLKGRRILKSALLNWCKNYGVQSGSYAC
ncbi:hypothetical protein C5167_008354 [Papaver somniferum]|uniref:Uncharacterized protein n=1 Tax=Papaver somniferum TaxID=3469 RepID=A0A4Y7JUA5_PAPSO|nr:hypothetical protein C5167_008354 [Papaver somniferum]